MAGATANYVYYWHCREQIGKIKKGSWTDPVKQDEALKEAGGVQPYVIYVGIAFYVLFIMTMIKMLQDGPTDGERSPESWRTDCCEQCVNLPVLSVSVNSARLTWAPVPVCFGL